MSTQTNTIYDDWLTVGEVAERLGIGRASIYSAVRSGALRAAKVNGRGDIRISARWASQWMESRSLTNTTAYSTERRNA